MVGPMQPYVFLVHPKNVVAYLASVWKPSSVVDQGGIGIRNFWTFVKAEPASDKKDMIVNSTEALNSIDPLHLGSPDSWVTDLVWDRVMRIGPMAWRSPGRRSRSPGPIPPRSTSCCAPG